MVFSAYGPARFILGWSIAPEPEPRNDIFTMSGIYLESDKIVNTPYLTN